MSDDTPRWTFLTNHGHVLLCLAQAPGLRVRDIALQVGVTERAVQRIVGDLEQAGYLTRHRSGRQNEYEINRDLPLRHPVEAHQTVRSLMQLVDGERPLNARLPLAPRPGAHPLLVAREEPAARPRRAASAAPRVSGTRRPAAPLAAAPRRR